MTTVNGARTAEMPHPTKWC